MSAKDLRAKDSSGLQGELIKLRRLVQERIDGSGGVPTTKAIGEEGGVPSTRALGEEGGVTRARGETVIEVTFIIDGDGILNVRAKDKLTNNETRATMRVIGAPERVSPSPENTAPVSAGARCCRAAANNRPASASSPRTQLT